MKTNVWIINHHAGNMFFDQGGRHYSFAKYLIRQGYNPTIFCSNSSHGKNEFYFENIKIWRKYVSEKDNIPFVFIKSRKYNDNGIKRIVSMIDFYRNCLKAAKQYANQYVKPDIILASSVHPLACVAGIKLAKKYDIKCIVEIRDLWPESIVAYKMASKDNIFVKLLYKLEKWIYWKADAIVFTVEGGKDYILEKGWSEAQGGPIDLNKVFYINNGVDLEKFDYDKYHYILQDEDLKNNSLLKVVYTGSIRHANNIGYLLDIAKHIGPYAKFLIWGEGDEVDTLKKRVVNEKIDNLIFKGRVSKQYIPYIVSHADINLMDMQESNEIFRFGVSPNKMFDYVAAEKPIISYQIYKYNPVKEYNIGIVAESLDEIIEYIKGYKENKCKYDTFVKDNYEKARKDFSYEKHTKKLIKIIES